MPHKFDHDQHIDAQGRLAHATGPVKKNEKIFWISAFVYQNGSGHYAAAKGAKKWPNGRAPEWSCATKMAPGSKPFNKGTAKAWALALVSDGPGKKFHGWSDDVELK
jgi:hypothetical protein